MQKEYDQTRLNTRFDKESSRWQKIYEPAQKRLSEYHNKRYRQQYTLELLGNGSGRILELGCGPGSYFQFLERLGYQVIGLDLSSHMVDLAAIEVQKLKNSRVIRGNALQLPFADNTFDALLAVGLLEYFPSDEDFLNNVRRIIRPGGRIVLTLRNALCLERKLWKCYREICIRRFQIDYYYREHNPKEFEALLVSMKFQNIQKMFCHFYPFPWPISAVMRQLNAFLSHKMEEYFSKSFIAFLGSTYLVAFDVPKQEL